MQDKNAETPARLRDLADQLECLLEDDFLALAKITPGTADAWRKRRKGPDWIRIGNRVLYPRKAVANYLDSLKRLKQEPRRMVKDLL